MHSVSAQAISLSFLTPNISLLQAKLFHHPLILQTGHIDVNRLTVTLLNLRDTYCGISIRSLVGSRSSVRLPMGIMMYPSGCLYSSPSFRPSLITSRAPSIHSDRLIDRIHLIPVIQLLPTDYQKGKYLTKQMFLKVEIKY